MEKGRDKKGQGLPTSTLVLLIMAGVVLVVVILGFTMGWGYIFDKIGFLPDDLTVATEACKTYAGSESLALSYCQYRELRIDGKKQFMNCDQVYAKAITVLGSDKVGFGIQGCEVDEVEYCEQLKTSLGKEKYKDSVVVNGKSCSERGVIKET